MSCHILLRPVMHGMSCKAQSPDSGHMTIDVVLRTMRDNASKKAD